MKNSVTLLLLCYALLVACKKDNDTPQDGKAESDAITNAIAGKKYRISAIIKVGGNTDARAEFPACLLDDTYFIRSAGTLQIIQGEQRCGTHTQDTVNASWGFGYHETGALKSLFFSLYTTGNTYTEIEFLQGNYTVNTSTGQDIKLILTKNAVKYAFTLVKL